MEEIGNKTQAEILELQDLYYDQEHFIFYMQEIEDLLADYWKVNRDEQGDILLSGNTFLDIIPLEVKK